MPWLYSLEYFRLCSKIITSGRNQNKDVSNRGNDALSADL